MASSQQLDGDSLIIGRNDSGAGLWQGFANGPRPGVLFSCQLDDCSQFVGGDWTETKVNTGTTTISTTKVSALNTTTSGASGDSNNLQRIAPTAIVAAGKRYWFESTFQVDDATNAQWALGLSVTNTTLGTPTTSILFSKASGGTSVNFVTSNSSTSTTQTGVLTMVAGVDYKFGFIANGASSVDYYINDVKIGTVSTQLPAVGSVLRQSYLIKAGTAAARTALVSTLYSAQEN